MKTNNKKPQQLSLTGLRISFFVWLIYSEYLEPLKMHLHFQTFAILNCKKEW